MAKLNSKLMSKPNLHIPGYVLAALLISTGGLLNGYDTGSIGAITVMPYFQREFGVLTPQIRGFVVSFIMLTAAIPSVFAGHLADRFGRLSIVMAGAIVFALGTALQAGSSALAMLLVGRALAGFGEGLYLGNLNVYICEIAPKAKRGALVAMPQLLVTAGTCLGYFTCYGSVRIESSISWRLPFIIQAIGGILLFAFCCIVPGSPRWMVLHGCRDGAVHALKRLDVSTHEAEKDILGPAEQELRSQPTTSGLQGFLTIFNRQHLRRTMLGLFILGMVQLCGIDGVLYYAPTLFAQAGLSAATASFLASGVSGLAMLAISIPALIFADRWGRRTSVISGGLVLLGCMFTIGSLYASQDVHMNKGGGRWVVIVLLFLFAMTYVSTWGIVGKIYATEIQPTESRAAANSVAQGVNFLMNWLVAFATPIFLARSSFGPYLLFGTLTLFTVVVLTIFMPETRGKSLESIQEVFHRPAMGSWVTTLRERRARKKVRGSAHRTYSSQQSSGPSPALSRIKLESL